LSKKDKNPNNDKANRDKKNPEPRKPERKPELKKFPRKKFDFLKKELEKKLDDKYKKTIRRKVEAAPSNVEPSDLEEFLYTLTKVGDNLCKLYARCWSTATSCYERQFSNKDKEDREIMIAIAGDLFLNCVEAFETQCMEDEEGEEDWE